MKEFGIIGYPLAHSFSQKYFTEKFEKLGLQDHRYSVFPIKDISEFTGVIRNCPGLRGLSVTIPHKETVLAYLDEVDPTAAEIGAVNCVKVVQRIKHKVPGLIGYNTDTFGFRQALKPFLESHHERALILGTGGASKAVAHVLQEIGIDFHFVSRSRTGTRVLSYDELGGPHLEHFPLIINTTPLGMYPNVGSCPPIPYGSLSSKNFLFDLVYNPDETLFLKKGKEKGALTQNGLTMLHQQAEKAWEIWNA